MPSRRGTARLALASLVGLAPPPAAADASQAPPEPVRMSAEIGGDRAVVEVRDLPPAEAVLAVRQALGTLAAIERELSRGDADGTLERLNAAAGKGLQRIDAGIAGMLESVLGFCVWSQGANGPMGGLLYDLWEGAAVPPSPGSLERAVHAAACVNLTVERQPPSAAIAAGSVLDLRHFAIGHAVDRAMADLRQHGSANAWIEFRSVMRGIGPGPAGKGWEATLPAFPGMIEAPDPVHLRDRAMAVVSTHRLRFRFGATSYPAFLDQRSGRPSTGTVAVVVASELALDAQAIGTTMVVLGNREGQLRLGSVIPSPSVLWLLGDGAGEPLLATHKWSELP
jgi:thiamine biosynthesis lipoprotein ApbE